MVNISERHAIPWLNGPESPFREWEEAEGLDVVV
jgi:hypothetical protein